MLLLLLVSCAAADLVFPSIQMDHELIGKIPRTTIHHVMQYPIDMSEVYKTRDKLVERVASYNETELQPIPVYKYTHVKTYRVLATVMSNDKWLLTGPGDWADVSGCNYDHRVFKISPGCMGGVDTDNDALYRWYRKDDNTFRTFDTSCVVGDVNPHCYITDSLSQGTLCHDRVDMHDTLTVAGYVEDGVEAEFVTLWPDWTRISVNVSADVAELKLSQQKPTGCENGIDQIGDLVIPVKDLTFARDPHTNTFQMTWNGRKESCMYDDGSWSAYSGGEGGRTGQSNTGGCTIRIHTAHRTREFITYLYAQLDDAQKAQLRDAMPAYTPSARRRRGTCLDMTGAVADVASVFEKAHIDLGLEANSSEIRDQEGAMYNSMELGTCFHTISQEDFDKMVADLQKKAEEAERTIKRQLFEEANAIDNAIDAAQKFADATLEAQRKLMHEIFHLANKSKEIIENMQNSVNISAANDRARLRAAAYRLDVQALLMLNNMVDAVDAAMDTHVLQRGIIDVDVYENAQKYIKGTLGYTKAEPWFRWACAHWRNTSNLTADGYCNSIGVYVEYTPWHKGNRTHGVNASVHTLFAQNLQDLQNNLVSVSRLRFVSQFVRDPDNATSVYSLPSIPDTIYLLDREHVVIDPSIYLAALPSEQMSSPRIPSAYSISTETQNSRMQIDTWLKVNYNLRVRWNDDSPIVNIVPIDGAHLDHIPLMRSLLPYVSRHGCTHYVTGCDERCTLDGEPLPPSEHMHTVHVRPGRAFTLETTAFEEWNLILNYTDPLVVPVTTDSNGAHILSWPDMDDARVGGDGYVYAPYGSAVASARRVCGSNNASAPARTDEVRITPDVLREIVTTYTLARRAFGVHVHRADRNESTMAAMYHPVYRISTLQCAMLGGRFTNIMKYELASLKENEFDWQRYVIQGATALMNVSNVTETHAVTRANATAPPRTTRFDSLANQLHGMNVSLERILTQIRMNQAKVDALDYEIEIESIHDGGTFDRILRYLVYSILICCCCCCMCLCVCCGMAIRNRSKIKTVVVEGSKMAVKAAPMMADKMTPRPKIIL